MVGFGARAMRSALIIKKEKKYEKKSHGTTFTYIFYIVSLLNAEGVSLTKENTSS